MLPLIDSTITAEKQAEIENNFFEMMQSDHEWEINNLPKLSQEAWDELMLSISQSKNFTRDTNHFITNS